MTFDQISQQALYDMYPRGVDQYIYNLYPNIKGLTKFARSE
jgi:hypothetical protein